MAQAENEWGHVTKEQYPGVITGTFSDFDPTGQANTLTWGGAVGDQFAYTYDGFGNLHQQARSLQAGYTETYAYDTLQRLTSATRNGTTVNYTYSASGNLTQKSDYGSTYTYAPANTHTNGCGPHAVNVAGAYSYTCDGNGNVIGGNTLAMTYDFENFARTATRSGTGSATWAHDANGQIDFSSSKGNRFYAPDGYEQVGSGSTAQQIHELGPVVVTRTGGLASSDTVSVVLRDRLGSTIDVIDNDTPTTRSYDAFGKPISGSGNLLSPPALNLTDTIHGFTKHEHDDSVLLINTVGRLYDYQLGRFLQVDPFVSGSGSQALNPYSYIGNNPLSGTDPTGYQECTVSQGNSCTANLHDSRSADPFSGRVTLTMGSDGGINAYGSSGGSLSAMPSYSNGGTSGQSATSAGAVQPSAAGDPNVDRSSRPEGNPASPNNNGGPNSGNVASKNVHTVTQHKGGDFVGPLTGESEADLSAAQATVGNIAATVNASGDESVKKRYNQIDFAYSLKRYELDTGSKVTTRATHEYTDLSWDSVSATWIYKAGLVTFYPGFAEAYRPGTSMKNYNYDLVSGPRAALFMGLHELGHGVRYGIARSWDQDQEEIKTQNWAYGFMRQYAPNVGGGEVTCESSCQQ